MALFEMPVDQLMTYQGRNPRPDDFDQLWDKWLRELRSIDAQVEMKPGRYSTNSVECFDLFFTGVGGARIYAKYLRPARLQSPAPAVVSFHGYSGNSGDWFNFRSWVAEGFAVAAIDVRGQGGRSEDVGGVTGNTHHGHIIRGLQDSPEKMLFRSIYLDCAQLVGIVMDLPEVDASRVGVTGGSQGGGLTLAAAALEPRVKLCAPLFPFLCDYQRVWEMDLADAAYAELKTYFRLFDPMHSRQEEIFTKLGYIDVQHLAPRINAEVLMFTALMDTICPPSTQFAAYNKITSKKNVVFYPDFGHEGLPGAGDKTLEFMLGLKA